MVSLPTDVLVFALMPVLVLVLVPCGAAPCCACSHPNCDNCLLMRSISHEKRVPYKCLGWVWSGWENGDLRSR